MWRAEDNALLGRLEDELLLERVWAAHAGPCARAVAAPHARASGMITLVRGSEEGASAAAAALDHEDIGALAALLAPDALSGHRPALLHHLALYHDALADALSTGGAALADRARHARLRSIGAWLCLADDPHYLRQLADAVVGEGIAAAEIERAVASAPFEPLDELGRRSRVGAREHTDDARAALDVLHAIGSACEMARCNEATAHAALRRAESLRVAAIDEALAPIESALADAAARGEPAARRGEILARVSVLWEWAREAEEVERFAIEQAQPIGWEIYREKRWDELRRMLAPLVPLVDRLAKRIAADPTRIAYAAPCAQMLVFRAEVETTLDGQREIAERAIELCPTHRNGRLVLAEILCERAIRTLDSDVWGIDSHAYARASADVERAEKLFPTAGNLPSARKRLERAARRRTG